LNEEEISDIVMKVLMRGFLMTKSMKYIGLVIFLVSLLIFGMSCATKSGRDIGRGTSDIGPDRGIEGMEIPGEGLDGTLYGLADINFEFDKSSLTPEAQRILKENAQWLRNNPTVMVEIEGHCDERGTIEYNLALGDRRARSAKDFLVNLGISSSRMTTISYGEEMPLDSGHTEAAWAKNRRAHFTIIAK
jgi:peptidoglycan-associated lipoprotein